MGKIKYFRTLPENQKYLYKSFASVTKNEGVCCDECGTFIQNIVTVVGSVDHISYNLGLTCCEKQAKIDGGLDLDDKVAVQVKFWKSRINKLKKFRKDFDKANREDTVAILGKFMYDRYKKIAKVDFGFLYKQGEWYWMHSNFPITKIFNKVKDTFSDIWDKVDWMGMDECAKMETSAEVYNAITSQVVKCYDFDYWTKTKYPEWEQKNTIRWTLECAVRDAGYQYGPGKRIKLMPSFNPYEYPEGLFDEIAKGIKWVEHPAFEQSEFIVTNAAALAANH